MKYFIDQEFIEGFRNPTFGRDHHFIDMISIGIVAEDGREYSALSSEYNFKEASPWVVANVLTPLYISTVHGDNRNHYDVSNFHKHYGLTNKQIKNQVEEFIVRFHSGDNILREVLDSNGNPITFYGYYADYDWVLFCSLFGTMMDLPNGFPMYCRDLKQMLDEYNEKEWYPGSLRYMEGSGVNITLGLALEKLKALDDYPKETNEHNALADAKWNKQLYEFLTK